jgi:hypothetical protein
MNHEPTTFRELIDRFGGIPAIQSDLGVPYVTAQKMYQRDSIAVRHWPRLMSAAAARDIRVTADALVKMAAVSHSETEH